MPKFDDYVNIRKEKAIDKDFFLNNERMRQFGSEEISSDYDLSAEQLNEHFTEREETGTFQDRTRYYFQDAEVMEAKAARYHSIANPATMREQTSMDMFSSKYKNHSARKRKKSAKQAAAAFKKTAKLEDKYKGDFEKNSKVSSLDKLKHRKEILTARLEGMEKAAAVKSTSKENEKYRILKAHISCHRILYEQIVELQRLELDKKIKEILQTEIDGVRRAIEEDEAEMSRMIPPVAKQWEKGLGMPAATSKKLAENQNINPEINEDDCEVQMKMNAMNSYMLEDETMRTMQNLEANGMYKGFKANVAESSRVFAFGMRTVLRDKNGLPVNKEEAKKDKENQKWKDALARGNVEEKNRIIVSRFEDFMKIRIPSPEELQKKGVVGLLRENPAELNDLLNFSTSIGNIRKIDPFVKEYEAAHPEMTKKLDAAVHFSTVVTGILADKHLLKRGGREYEITENVSKAEANAEHVEDMRSETRISFAKSYNNYINDKAYSDEVGKQLRSTQKKSMEYFHKNFTDTFDGAMRKKLGTHMESKLGNDLASGKAKGDIQRLRNQDIMRSGLNAFLNKRQSSIAAATEEQMYNFLIAKKVWDEKKDIEKKLPEMIDKDFLQYSMDWVEGKNCNISNRANSQRQDGSINGRIAEDGKKLLKVDISKFNYNTDEEFVSGLKDNYVWLKRAESLNEVMKIVKAQNGLKITTKVPLTALEGRIKTLLEVKADYDARIDMINSNYYAQIPKEDLDKLSDEQLNDKISNALQNKDDDLSKFLNSYKTLRDKKDEFKMGSAVRDRERALTTPLMEKEADKQNAVYKQIKGLGLIKHKNEKTKDYEERVKAKLIEEASKEIPQEIDSNYIKENKVRINGTMANLGTEEIQKLESWIEDQMSDENALKKKGVTEEELAKLHAIRKNLYEARRNLDIYNNIMLKLCAGWDIDDMESPDQNLAISKEANKRHYQLMKAPSDAVKSVAGTIGTNKKQKLKADERYMTLIQSFCGIFVKHKIYFNKDLDDIIKGKEEFAESMILQRKKEGQKVSVNIGGKTFDTYYRFNFMSECNNLDIDEKDIPLVEEKLKALDDLGKKIECCHLVVVDAKEGMYTREVDEIHNSCGVQAIKIKDEIKALAKKK